MKQSKKIQDACRVLRARVRFENAGLRLPGNPFGSDQTAEIRKATRIYVESWIVPLLDAIEEGNLGDITDQIIATDRRHPIGFPPEGSKTRERDGN